MRSLTRLKNIYRNTKIYSQQQSKIHSNWHAIKDYQAWKEAENVILKEEKKKKNQNQSRIHTDVI